ncbi:unnamed protein product [Durusdinium trenchii]|uniref:Prolyl 4-hydroxylase alpha subunit domain-containing protein n=1 Tax=Durusdinium trenchii TaxID=1381693 RepID=A0ABP0MFW9_9DINO
MLLWCLIGLSHVHLVLSAAIPLSASTGQGEVGWRRVSESPLVLVHEKFFSKEECEELMQIALESGRMQEALVYSGHRKDAFQRDDQVRSNSHMYVEREDELKSSLLQRVIARMHHAAKIPERLGEKLQIARYQEGERYEMHHDSGPEVGRARPATLLVYLNDVEKGGETVFPLTREVLLQCRPIHHQGDQVRYGVDHCCHVQPPELLTIQARQGDALINLSGLYCWTTNHSKFGLLFPPKNRSNEF